MTQITGRQIKDGSIKDSHVPVSALSKSKINGLIDDESRIQVLSLLQSIKDTVLKYTEYLYSPSGKIETIKVWEDDTMTVQLFETNFTYTGSKVSQITIERISDSFTYIKEFSYDINGRLVSKFNHL